jgi:hypothetical protein
VSRASAAVGSGWTMMLVQAAAGRIGARGPRYRHFWRGVWSAGPWLGGGRANR